MYALRVAQEWEICEIHFPTAATDTQIQLCYHIFRMIF